MRFGAGGAKKRKVRSSDAESPEMCSFVCGPDGDARATLAAICGAIGGDEGLGPLLDDENPTTDSELEEEEEEEEKAGGKPSTTSSSHTAAPPSAAALSTASAVHAAAPSPADACAPLGGSSILLDLSSVTETHKDVHTFAEMREKLPNYEIGKSWTIMRKVPELPLGKIRCIQGASFRMDCRCHTAAGAGLPKCKMHIGINANWEAAQCLLQRWAMHGLSSDHAGHLAEAQRLQARWRDEHKAS